MARIGKEYVKDCPNKDTFCGGRHMIADVDFGDNRERVSVWRCSNCGATLPRKEYKRGVEQTPAQAATLEAFKDAIVKYHSNGTPETSEFKAIETELDERGDLRVRCVYGSKGDEGTMLSVFGRYHYQAWIGRRGGIWAFEPKSKTYAKLHGVFKVALSGYTA